MKRAITIFIIFMLWATTVLAGDDQPISDVSLFFILFIGLGVIPIVSQLIIGLLQLYFIFKGILGKAMRKGVPEDGARTS